MKKIVYFGIILSVIMLSACGKSSVEGAAKEYVKKQLAFDNNFRVDTSDLRYTVTKKEGNRAIVRVSGSLDFDGELYLVKHGKKWTMAKKESAYATQQSVASHTEQKKTVSPARQMSSHNQAVHN